MPLEYVTNEIERSKTVLKGCKQEETKRWVHPANILLVALDWEAEIVNFYEFDIIGLWCFTAKTYFLKFGKNWPVSWLAISVYNTISSTYG